MKFLLGQEESKPGVFLVGCPRSGTTALQTRLSRHAGIVTFPESHFFDRMLANRNKLRRVLRLPNPLAFENLRMFAKEIGLEIGISDAFLHLISIEHLTNLFISLLSRKTCDERGNIWLEKTPGHSHYISFIDSNVDGAKFIHLIRDGRQVIPSLYRVTRQHSEYWSGAWSLEKCIDRWKSAINDSTQFCQPSDRHLFLFYDELIDNPRLSLLTVFEFLGLRVDEVQLSLVLGGDAGNDEHIFGFEGWKLGSLKPLNKSLGNRGSSLLGQAELEYVEEMIANVDLSVLRSFARENQWRKKAMREYT